MSYNEFARVGNEASWKYAFAQRLKDLVKRKKINVTQFSRKIGLPKSAMDSYMNGTSIPNYYRMTLIADGLGMTVEKLADISPNADLYDDDYEEEIEEMYKDEDDLDGRGWGRRRAR